MSERFRPPVEQQKKDQMFPEREQLFGLRTDVVERAKELEELLASQDTTGVQELLRDSQLLENFVIQKGEQSHYLDVVEAAVAQLLQDIAGESIGNIQDAADVRRVVNAGMPLMALGEMVAIDYHKNRDDDGVRLAQALMSVEGISVVARANAANCLGAILARHENYRGASAANKQGLDFLAASNEEETDSNHTWIRLKIQHGLVWNRFHMNAHDDMVGQFLRIAEARASFDIPNQFRAIQDAARVARDTGQVDHAVYLMEQAARGFETQEYWSAQAQALQELAALHRQSGNAGRGRRQWVKGIGLGERLRLLREPALRAEKEFDIRVPARCLLDVGDGRLLIDRYEFDGEERFGLLLIDQEQARKKEGVSPDSVVRKKLAGMLQQVAQEQSQSPVAVSPRMMRLFKADTRSQADEKLRGYSTMVGSLELTEALQGVDKLPKSGYVLFDEASQALLQKELERRAQKAKGS